MIRWSRVLAVSGLAASALGLLDPSLQPIALPGALVASVGLLLGRDHATEGRFTIVALMALAWTYALTAWSEPRFAADSPSYYVYLRSAFFDADLDFGNEWATWGLPKPPTTATGRQANVHAVGAAILWSPFFVLAHGYVKLQHLFGREVYPSDGFSLPYIRSVALGSGALAVSGAVLLVSTLSRRFGGGVSALAVTASVMSSPIPYYIFVMPGMAHAAVFSLACAFVVAWVRAEEAPSRRAWLLLGALLGALALTRWQAIVFAAFLLPLLVSALRLKGRLAWRWLAEAAGVTLLVFSPQLAAWQVLFGSPFAVPDRQHGMDWSSPHLAEVIFSADRGLFSWTPLLALGLVGLLGQLFSRWRGFAVASLLVFSASVWVNGGVKDWAGADAFAARRFDLVVPLFAIGIVAVTAVAHRAIARRPWLATASVFAVAVAWNLGLMRLYRDGVFTEAAPAEQLVARQVRQARLAIETLALQLGGPRLRKLAYDFFVGEYLYWNVNLDGTIDLARESRFVREGWSGVRQRAGGGSFRWALLPRACLALPLQRPLDLRSFVRLRAPAGVEDQTMSIVVNGAVVASHQVPSEWTDLAFEIPARVLEPGPNSLCFEFQRGGSEEPGGVGAAVRLVQLP